MGTAFAGGGLRACGKFELIDGFKRYVAAGQIGALTSLSVRVLEVDEPTAKAAILSLNRDQRPVRELEEALGRARHGA